MVGNISCFSTILNKPPFHSLSLPESNPPLFILVQPLHTIPTVEMHNRMALLALNDGSTIVWNPIAPTEETLREIKDSFGSPGALFCFFVRSTTRRKARAEMQDTRPSVFSPFRGGEGRGVRLPVFASLRVYMQ